MGCQIEQVDTAFAGADESRRLVRERHRYDARWRRGTSAEGAAEPLKGKLGESVLIRIGHDRSGRWGVVRVQTPNPERLRNDS